MGVAATEPDCAAAIVVLRLDNRSWTPNLASALAMAFGPLALNLGLAVCWSVNALASSLGLVVGAPEAKASKAEAKVSFRMEPMATGVEETQLVESSEGSLRDAVAATAAMRG